MLSAAVLTLVLAACGGADDSSSGSGTPTPTVTDPTVTASAPTDTTTADAAPSTVTLITAGEEPRTELRYDFADGEPIDATARQTQEVAQTIDGQPGAGVSITSLFDMVGEVETDGDTFTARVSLENFRLADDTDPALRESAGDSLSAFNGLTVVDTFDARGQSIERAIENAEEFGDDPTTMSMLDSLLQQDAFSYPLPTEPVGVGARWSSTKEVQVQGIPIVQTVESELLSIDGTVVEVAFTTTQEVPPGPVALAGVPGEVEIDVWDVTGDGTSLVDLTRPVPTSEARTRGHQEMTSTADGQTSTLEQDLSAEIELAPN